MKNKITLPPGVDPLPFFQQMTEHLSNNLDKKLCNSVSNLLAIDYASRLKSKPPLKEYINICIERLKKYLGPQVVLDNDFSASMTLFTAAITPEKDDNEKAQKQLQDALIESTIASLFGDMTPEEQATITLILRDLLNSKDGNELMNIISSDPKRFYSIVTSAIKTKKQQQEILESVEMYLVNVMNQSKKIDQKVNGIKNTIGKIALAGSVLVATSIGLVIGGFALPVLLVPATIAAVKYGPVVGKKLGGNIAKNSTFIQRETNSLERIKTVSISTAQTINKTVIPLSKDQIKSLTQNVDTNSVKTVKSQDKETNSKTKTVLEQKAKSTDKGKQI